jgi:hypothetical protein
MCCSITDADSIQAIENWYKGKDNTANSSLPTKTQTWNLLRIVQHLKIDEINRRIPDKPGSREYLGKFRGVSGDICNKLPADVRLDYEALVDKWNAKSPPQELQAK